MEENKIELSGIFEEGYGIAPKKLLRMHWENTTVSESRNIKLLLCYLLSYTGAGNIAFPSINKISVDLELSRNVVMDIIKKSIELKLLSKGKMIDENGKEKQNNIYRLDFIIPKEEKIIQTKDGKHYKIKIYDNQSSGMTSHQRYPVSAKPVIRDDQKPVIRDDPNNNIGNNNIGNNNITAGAENLHKFFVDYFHKKYLEIHNQQFNWKVNSGKEHGQIDNIIKVIETKENIIKVIDSAFCDNFWVNKLTPTVIYSNLNKFLLGAKNGKQSYDDDREREYIKNMSPTAEFRVAR